MHEKNLKLADKPGHKAASKTEVKIIQVPFKYDFRTGSADSLKLLDCFSESNTEEFVLSPWKEVVKSKWYKGKPWLITIALIYWMFMISCTISVVFFPKSNDWQTLTVSLLCVILAYEIVQITSYLVYNPLKYFLDIWNIIDWLLFILILVYFYVINKNQETDAARVMGSMLMIVVYYRAFSYLQMLDSFTALVGIINIIIQKLIIFFIILFYFYIATALLIIKIDPENSIKMSFMHAYYFTLFGGVDDNSFTMFNYVSIPIVFGTLMVSIVLLNVLIAFLSNLFSRLEEQQLVNDLKEKASLVLDIEVIFMFFKYKLTGKLAKTRRLHRRLMSSTMYPELSFAAKKHARKKRKKENYLFIFKTVDFDELEDDNSMQDNLVNKLKNVEKKIDANQRKHEQHVAGLLAENAEIKGKLDAILKKIDSAKFGSANPLRFSNIKPYYF